MYTNLFEGILLHRTEQSITCKMRLTSSKDEGFILTIVYGYNERNDRRVLWRELRYQNQPYGDIAWLMMGDFNIILMAKENR